jgi:hypothetical protein
LHDHSKVKIEIPVDGYDAELRNGVTDYCLFRENGEVLAVGKCQPETVQGDLLNVMGLPSYCRQGTIFSRWTSKT